jgi:hypothetical protein
MTDVHDIGTASFKTLEAVVHEWACCRRISEVKVSVGPASAKSKAHDLPD